MLPGWHPGPGWHWPLLSAGFLAMKMSRVTEPEADGGLAGPATALSSSRQRHAHAHTYCFRVVKGRKKHWKFCADTSQRSKETNLLSAEQGMLVYRSREAG